VEAVDTLEASSMQSSSLSSSSSSGKNLTTFDEERFVFDEFDADLKMPWFGMPPTLLAVVVLHQTVQSSSLSSSSPSGKNLTFFDEERLVFDEFDTDLKMPKTRLVMSPTLLGVHVTAVVLLGLHSSSLSSSSPSGKNLTTFDEERLVFDKLDTDLKMPKTRFVMSPILLAALVLLEVLLTFLRLSSTSSQSSDRQGLSSGPCHSFNAWHKISALRSLRPLRSAFATVFN